MLERFLHEHPSFGGFPGPMKVKSSKKDDAERIARFPQLHPFRSLDVQRLKIVGILVVGPFATISRVSYGCLL